MKITKTSPKKILKQIADYIIFALKWTFLATGTGVLSGFLGTVFYKALHFVNDLRAEHGFILLFLPLGGVLIALLYRVSKLQSCEGTNTLMRSAESDERVPFLLVPAVFLATTVTHLVGGSVGKEGAALQLGGTIGYTFARAMRVDKNDRKILMLCGMSGFFAALFGTPITATVFAMEFIAVGTIYYSGFFACILSSLSAILTTNFFGISHTLFELSEIPTTDALSFLKVLGVSVIIALATVVFVVFMHSLEHIAERFIKIHELRGAIGGCLLIAMTAIVGNQNYNGAGMETIELIMSGGSVFFLAFAIKMLFTAVSIAAGFKGGEIVPSFFIGATLGYAIAPIFGLNPIFCAAIGLVAFFSGVSNCTLTSIILSVELFGGDGIFFFALACVTVFALSGNLGLFKSQKFVFSKTHGDEKEETE